METDFREFARMRAGRCCEYCRLPEAHSALSFHLDHIVAKQHGGGNAHDNIALACCYCNRYKGPNLTGIDPASGRITRLFHPRQDEWETHFRWNKAQLTGLTPEGRATIDLLQINHVDAVALRELLIQEDVFIHQARSVHEPHKQYR